MIDIYHGSVNIVEKPVFGAGKPYNDYGLLMVPFLCQICLRQ